MKFRGGKIIEIFYAEKRGKKLPIIIRYPSKKDAKVLLDLYNTAIRETEFLATITPFTLAREKKWLNEMLGKCRKGKAVHIVAESGKKIIGGAGLERKHEEVQRHVGTFGIAILQKFAGLGLGTRLMKLIEKDARALGIEIIYLSVYKKNKIAQNLYKKMGFVEAGRIPNFIKRGKKYDTDIMMYKTLRQR